MCHRRLDSQLAMASQSTPPRWATRASVKRRRGFGRRHSNGDVPRTRRAVGAYPELRMNDGLADEGDAITGIEREMSDRAIVLQSVRFHFQSMQSWLHPRSLVEGIGPRRGLGRYRVGCPHLLLCSAGWYSRLPRRPIRSAAAHSRHRGFGRGKRMPEWAGPMVVTDREDDTWSKGLDCNVKTSW